MIINKASFERGFGYGCIYKTEYIDLRELSKTSKASFLFGIITTESKIRLKTIGWDGLPYVGARLEPGDTLCWFVLQS